MFGRAKGSHVRFYVETGSKLKEDGTGWLALKV